VDNKIVLITPPDKLFNQNPSCLLIHPRETIRQEAQEILARSNNAQNIYLYNVNDDQSNVDWLLTVAKISELVILDLDNSPEHVRVLGSYLVSLPHTYWLTSEDWMQYNKLSSNRIYGLDVVEHLIGGSIETEQ